MDNPLTPKVPLRFCYLTLGTFAVLALGPDVSLDDIGLDPEDFSPLAKIDQPLGEGLFLVPKPNFLKAHPFSFGSNPLISGTAHLIDDTHSRPWFLHPGLTALVAPPAYGKTTLLRERVVPLLSPTHRLVDLTFLEVPEDQAQPIGPVSPVALLAIMAQALVDIDGDKPLVVIVDSIRAFLYGESIGATREGGLDGTLFAQLTALAVVFASASSAVILTINPVSFTESSFQGVITSLIAGVTAVWHAPADSVVRLPSPEQGRPFTVVDRGPTAAARDSAPLVVGGFAVGGFERGRIGVSVGWRTKPSDRAPHGVPPLA